ncbi:hypothetical protein [Halosimplex pelagicum]|uniref:Uncharacterized protein n=1 Tax=Halosimplex pelagicum TaxID=869886 RepID=A0A7D5TI23_9EURY|nr:hypothetical protein [Halosimplex pelagicum]QLH83396.1 hypothetical protein HZS54_17935 [Halosimplex pelagicum]
MSENNLTHLEWQRRQASREDEWNQRTRVSETIDRASRALADSRRDYDLVAELLVDVLVPALLGPHGEHLHYYDREVGDSEKWDWVELTRFLDSPEEYRRDALTPSRRESPSIEELTDTALTDGGAAVAEQKSARGVIESAFESVAAIAEHEGIISDVSNVSRATGYELELGQLWSSYDWDHGDSVQLVSRNRGMPKTLFCGSTGAGKSTALGADIEDRYNSGYKIIDLVDTDEFENAVNDIPQSQEVLREVREDLELPVDFTESEEYADPNLEVLVPLTPEVRNQRIPFDEEGESVVRPFTIPASDLDQTTLVSFLSALVSRQQEASLRTAYDTVDREKDDWSLKDLAAEIADQDDLQESFRKRCVRLLHNLQNKGFIRTKECEYAIDWSEIFHSPETITAFSVAHVNEKTDQLMVLAYLIYSVYFARRRYFSLPPAVAVIRELHEVAPHREETEDDHRAEALQQAIVSNLSYELRKNRHQRLEFTCDTQDVMDIKKGVRKRFSRFAAFDMPEESLEKIFQYANESGANSAKKAMKSERGMGMVVGLSQPNVEDDVSFLSPIEFAPPSYHHFDVDEHNDGLEARADYLDEELETPEWSTGVPGDLRFEVDDMIEVEEGDSSAEIPPGLDSFVHECITFQSSERTKTTIVREAYNRFADAHGFDTRKARSFGKQFTKLEGVEAVKSGSRYYSGVLLNDRGHKYRNEDLEDQ